jgi:hypothetical protein
MNATPAEVDPAIQRVAGALSPAQKQFMRSLGGETIFFREYSAVKVTERTKASVGKRGLADYGAHKGSNTMGWRLTDDGEPIARFLIEEAREAREKQS